MNEILKSIFYVMTATMLITIILFLVSSALTLKSGTSYGELTRGDKIKMLAISVIASVYAYFGATEVSVQKICAVGIMLLIIAFSLILIKVSLENIYYSLPILNKKTDRE